LVVEKFANLFLNALIPFALTNKTTKLFQIFFL